MSDIITVKTSSTDEYPIFVGSDIFRNLLGHLSEQYYSSKAFVIVDAAIAELHGNWLKEALQSVFDDVVIYEVPQGESSKSIEQWAHIVDFVLNEGVERSTPLIAIGGGVVGDLAGFVAASVLRGIPLFHVPTTLLAMVDSSIGGKTGINHATGKNLIGSFYQPKAVYTDVAFLKTLPQKEWVNGLSEIIKYGMIESPELLTELAHLTQLPDFGQAEDWIPVITKSAQIKTDVVSRDVKESGVREFLNFGHTFAHVIETVGGYTGYSHGEAVYAGMFGAIKASNILGASVDVANLFSFKPLYTFSLGDIGLTPEELTKLMLRDKKVKDQLIRLVLLKDLGRPYVKPFKDTALIEDAWKYIMSVFS